MRTKLVYVLTCAPEKHYIEQALMSVFSARHWNPDAHIVLLVDDLTDKLLVGKRADVLDYISEKIVVPFDEASLSMMCRSRFIKTSVRQWIQGDYLFIDSDTIITRSLSEVDSYGCTVGAVLDSMIPVAEYCEQVYKPTWNQTHTIGVELSNEPYYFNSGVMYVKDMPDTHRLYTLWHQYWEEGTAKDLFIDQPSLAKANREMGRIIQQIPNYFNFMLWTRAKEPEKAYILHIASFRNPNFLFNEQMLAFVKREGLIKWVKECILHPCDCMLPFDYDVRHSSFSQRIQWIRTIARTMKSIEENLPELVKEFPMQSSFKITVLTLFHFCPIIGAGFWLFWKRLKLFRNNEGLMDNVCRKAI